MAENTEKEIKVKSLQKALDILNCFTKKSTWGVTELSEYLDLNKSNVPVSYTHLDVYKRQPYY